MIDKVLDLHKKGKIEIKSKINIRNKNDLSLAYTPGVARISELIHKNKDLVYNYTSKQNLVAIVTDGSAVLGLGNIGPEAALLLPAPLPVALHLNQQLRGHPFSSPVAPCWKRIPWTAPIFKTCAKSGSE